MRLGLPALVAVLAATPAQAQLWDRFQKMVNPEVDVLLQHPPELGIRIQRLAFATVATPIEDDLVQALIAELSGSGEIEILDRANVERILREQKFSNSGLVDEKSAVELGKLLGSPALVIVKVHHFTFNKSRRQDRATKKEKVDKKEVERTVITHVAKNQGDFVASIQAVDLATGKIYSAKRFVANPSLENRQDDTQPDFPPDSQLREMALQQARSQVRRMILPWNETRRLVFYDDSDYGMKDAYARLKLKDTLGALAKAQDALRKAKADPQVKPKYVGRTHYNVGMCHFILGDCETALPFLKTAQESDPDSGIFRDAVQECTRGVHLQEELRKATQKGGMPVPEAPKAEPKPEPPPQPKPQAAAEPKAAESKPSLEERLQRLEGLHKKGLITDEEYKKRREEILKEL